jgi:hypothetical protein
MATDNKQNVYFMESLREMRAQRQQQLRQAGQQQNSLSQLNRTMSSLVAVTNSNSRILSQNLKEQQNVVRTNRDLSRDIKGLASSITKSISSLTASLGRGLSTSASAAARGIASTATGAAGITSSLVDGISKALPVAVIGIMAKAFVWDKLNNDVKDRLTGSLGNLFSFLFRSIQPIFEQLIESLKGLLKMAAVEITAAMKATRDIIALAFKDITKQFSGFVEPLKHNYKVFERFLERMGEFINNYGPALGIATAGAGAYALSRSTVSGATSAATAATIRTPSLNAGAAAAEVQSGIASAGRNKQAIDFMKQNGFKGPVGRAELVAGRIFLRMFEKVPEATKNIVINSMKLRGFTVAGALTVAMEFLWVDWAKSEIDVLEKEALLTTEEAEELRKQIGIKAVGSVTGTLVGGALTYAGSSVIIEALKKVPKVGRVVQFGAGALKFGATLYGASKGGELGAEGAEQLYKGLSGMNLVNPSAVVDYDELVGRFNEGLEKGMSREEAMRYAKGEMPQGAVIPSTNMSVTSPVGQGSLAEVISKYESATGRKGYDQLFLGPGGKPFVQTSKPLTQMTIAEIRQVQKEQVAKTREAGIGRSDKTGKIIGTGAIGKYQFTQTTLAELLKKLGIKEDAIFDEALQDRLFKAMIQEDYDAFIKGELTTQEFSLLISKRWEAFRGPKAKKELDAYLAKTKLGTSADSLLAKEEVIKNEPSGDVDYGSEWMKRFTSYREQGYSELDAAKKTEERMAKEGESKAQGFVSPLASLVSPGQIKTFMGGFDIESIKKNLQEDAALLANMVKIKESSTEGGSNVVNNFNIQGGGSSGYSPTTTSPQPGMVRSHDAYFSFHAATNRFNMQ